MLTISTVECSANEAALSDRDRQLIARYQQAGCREALDQLVREHIGKVRSVVFPMVLDHSLADDLTQESIMKAVRGLPKFDGRAAFSTWLYRIAMNTVNSHFERNGRAPVTFQSEVPEPTFGGSAPDGVAVECELATDIETALQTLSPKLRAAIVLTCLQGLSADEAASIEGCSTGTMYSRVHEARKQLKQKLARHLT